VSYGIGKTTGCLPETQEGRRASPSGPDCRQGADGVSAGPATIMAAWLGLASTRRDT
jgi:hypothetical protein